MTNQQIMNCKSQITNHKPQITDCWGGPRGSSESTEQPECKAPGDLASAGECGGAAGNARMRAITTMGAAQCPEAGGSLLIAADCSGIRKVFESDVVGAEYL